MRGNQRLSHHVVYKMVDNADIELYGWCKHKGHACSNLSPIIIHSPTHQYLSMGLRSEDAYASELQTILRIAHALRDAAGVSHSNQQSLAPIRTNRSLVAVDSINLPSPPPLLPSLLEAGAGHEISAAANKIYQLRADELRKNIQMSVVTASHKIAELPAVASALSPNLLIRKVVSTATQLYYQRLRHWKEDIIERVKQASKSPTNMATPRNARTFNHVSIPITES